MQLHKDDMIIDVSRLYTVSNYAKKIGKVYNTVMFAIATGKLESVSIGGVQFIIHKEGEE